MSGANAVTGGEKPLRMGDLLRAAVAGLVRAWVEGWAAILVCAAVWSLRPFIGAGGQVWGWNLAAVVATLMLTGALARIAISPDAEAAKRLGLGPRGLQLGLTEARLLGAFLLCAVFLAMILSVAALALLAVFGMAGLDAEAIRMRDWSNVGPVWKLVLLALLTVFAFYAVVVMVVRLSLFAPATVGRGQMTSLNGMGITRGYLRPLLAGLVVTAAPKIGLLVLTGAGLISGSAGWVVWAVVLNGLQAPLTMAYLGAAYRRLEHWTPQGQADG